MNRQVYINAYASLTAGGIRSNNGFCQWDNGQAGPADVKRGQVLSQPNPTFGKLSLSDRLAFGVASLVLADYPLCAAERRGICLGIPGGSLSTDLRYTESIKAGFPSPALFSGTLPSSPVSEIAIFYKFKGPDRVIADIRHAELCAIDCGFRLILLNKADQILALQINGIDPGDHASPLVPDELAVGTEAFAVMLSGSKEGPGPQYRCALSLEAPAGAPGTAQYDGHLFDRITAALSNGENLDEEISADGYHGYISLTKDC